MKNSGLTKSLLAGAIVAAFRIVKFGTSDAHVIQSAAASDAHIGVSDLGAASGGTCSVIMGGIARVEYGGVVTRGAPLTADASGKAIVAAPAAGANVRIVGFAMVAGVAGDLGSVQLAPSVMQG